MKKILACFGILSLVLGIIGIFLPVLPTTPFLLLSAAIFSRTSPRLNKWLLNQRYLGTYIRNFRENKAIPLHAKIISTLLIWASLGYCIFFVLTLIWLKILFFILALAITVHINSYKTLK